jgi:hypothetical protein
MVLHVLVDELANAKLGKATCLHDPSNLEQRHFRGDVAAELHVDQRDHRAGFTSAITGAQKKMIWIQPLSVMAARLQNCSGRTSKKIR